MYILYTVHTTIQQLDSYILIFGTPLMNTLHNEDVHYSL